MSCWQEKSFLFSWKYQSGATRRGRDQCRTCSPGGIFDVLANSVSLRMMTRDEFRALCDEIMKLPPALLERVLLRTVKHGFDSMEGGPGPSERVNVEIAVMRTNAAPPATIFADVEPTPLIVYATATKRLVGEIDLAREHTPNPFRRITKLTDRGPLPRDQVGHPLFLANPYWLARPRVADGTSLGGPFRKHFVAYRTRRLSKQRAQ
jgi:hypothetical protein